MKRVLNVGSKTKKLILAAILVPSAIVITTFSVQAAYPVIDSQNIAKTIEVIKRTTEQINKINEQINLAKDHLSIVKTSMKDVSDAGKQVLTSLDGTRIAVDNVIKNTTSSFEGLLAPVKDIQNVAKETEKKWNTTFTSLSKLNPKNITYGALQGSNTYINAQVTKNNKEAVTETQAIMAGLTQAEEELAKLREQARKTVGQRDLAKISAEIDAVTARINGFNTKLTAIQVTNQNIESQAQQQQEANRATYNFTAAKNFSERVVDMKVSDKSFHDVFPSRYEQWKASRR